MCVCEGVGDREHLKRIKKTESAAHTAPGIVSIPSNRVEESHNSQDKEQRSQKGLPQSWEESALEQAPLWVHLASHKSKARRHQTVYKEFKHVPKQNSEKISIRMKAVY